MTRPMRATRVGTARMGRGRSAGQRVRASIRIGGSRIPRCLERSVIAEGEPQHERGDRELDQPEEHDQHPQRHRERCYYCPVASNATSELAALAEQVSGCRRCPRLVAWRERVAREPRAAFAREQYWARPVPGFGDPRARSLVVGLAPAAHGGNRTGRIFTGDRSGDFLFAALARSGFANQPTSTHRDDGLQLRDLYVAAVNRCAPPANRPTPQERDACLPFLARELTALD